MKTFLHLAVIAAHCTVVCADYLAYTQTPFGSEVEISESTWDFSLETQETKNASMAASYPEASLWSSASRMFNCHSHVWNNSGTSLPTSWMPPYKADGSANVALYWSDGSYTFVYNKYARFITESQAYNNLCHYQGLSIVYVPGNLAQSHSASWSWCTHTPGWAISKWGEYGEYYHALDHCPYPGPLNFYERTWWNY